jgi:hypothetical protein
VNPGKRREVGSKDCLNSGLSARLIILLTIFATCTDWHYIPAARADLDDNVSATSTSILKCKPFLPSTAQAIAVPSIVDVPDQNRTRVSIQAKYSLVLSRE